ncbi:MAG: HEAT repeat domain-containing protein [Gemmataceae bacterium]
MMYAPLAFLLIAQPILVKPMRRVQPAPIAPVVLSDEQVLKNVHLDTTGAALLAFFRQRVTPSVDAEQAAKLAKQLRAKDEAIHAKAMAELVGLGPLTVPALRRAVNHADNEETLTRARKCLQAIEGSSGSAVVQSAVRLLAARNPEGAVEALMNYLPFADDDSVVQEIETTLLAIGVRDGKPESALMRALTDPTPIRRGLAARVLCQIGGTAGCKAVRSLLTDAKPSVRMEAALSLTDSHDAVAVPILIDLVADLPLEGRKRVEKYLTELAGEWAVRTPQGGDALSGRLRRELWSTWWRTLDGKQLLDEFQNRTLSDEERTHALEWIGKLGDASSHVRAKASEELLRMGPRTSSLLRRILDQGNARPTDKGNAYRIESARQCLQALEGDKAKPMPEAAPRLLALRRPQGTVEALLAYLPFAESETLALQLTDLLASTGCNDGKADPALVRALGDKDGTRRAAAAVALCKGDCVEELPAVRKLLRDTDGTVRLRTALALAEYGDKTAVPVLIALLADLPIDQVWEAEDVLSTLAGDKAPNTRVSGDKSSRTASVDAWKAWWRKEEKNVDLARLSDGERDSGMLLVIENQGGRVVEMTRSGKIRRKIEGLQWPMDAVVCPNGNVFVIHQSGQWLSMRDRQGKQLWQRNANQAFLCQRLRNGNLFVVCRQQTLELDPNGKEVSSQLRPMGWIAGGCKFPNGHISLFYQQGQYVRYDASGKEVKRYQVAFQGGVAMNAEVLPGDRVVASLNIGRVAEYDGKGKTVWETNVVNPAFPHRLPNGHTLVARNQMNHLYELDRKGKIVSEKKDLEYRPWRIRRR